MALELEQLEQEICRLQSLVRMDSMGMMQRLEARIDRLECERDRLLRRMGTLS